MCIVVETRLRLGAYAPCQSIMKVQIKCQHSCWVLQRFILLYKKLPSTYTHRSIPQVQVPELCVKCKRYKPQTWMLFHRRMQKHLKLFGEQHRPWVLFHNIKGLSLPRLYMTLGVLMKSLSLSLPCREMVVRKVKRESLELMEEMYVNNYLM